jgi:hypothetical protein
LQFSPSYKKIKIKIIKYCGFESLAKKIHSFSNFFCIYMKKKREIPQISSAKIHANKKHDTTSHWFMNAKYAYIFRHNKSLSWALLELGPCLARLYIAQVLIPIKPPMVWGFSYHLNICLLCGIVGLFVHKT